MTLSIKTGVRLHGITPAMLVALQVIEGVYNEQGFDTVVTAGIDGKHTDGSFHYSGSAMDFRTNHVPVDKQPIILKAIQDRLGADFFAQIEVDHIHVQWKPKSTYGA